MRKDRPVRLTAGIFALMALFSGLAGCHKQGAATANSRNAPGKAEIVFHLGHQRDDAINLVKVRGDLERRLAAQGVRVEWNNFPAGPQLLEALGVGSVDFGSTGESPAIFAQAAGLPLVYVANVPPSTDGSGEALIVPKNSPIHTIADLKGKKVAFQKASSAHNFAVQVIERAGLAYLADDGKPSARLS